MPAQDAGAARRQGATGCGIYRSMSGSKRPLGDMKKKGSIRWCAMQQAIHPPPAPKPLGHLPRLPPPLPTPAQSSALLTAALPCVAQG